MSSFNFMKSKIDKKNQFIDIKQLFSKQENQMNQKQTSVNEKSERGRPKNSADVEVVHPQRQQKPQEIKQYWTQHRITLIAYEAQYIYNKKNVSKQAQPEGEERQKPGANDEKKSSQDKEKKRKGRKKADPEFETGFLFSTNKEQSSQEIKVEEMVKLYDNLSTLFSESNHDVDDAEVREFMKIMLELKNEQIVHQFLPLYDIIYKEISGIEFEKVEKQKDRIEFLKQIQTKLHNLITASPEGKFAKFKGYLKNDLKETLKLLYVESYCFLAEKFNFNINEFYAEAFSITLQHNKTGNKKVKGE